MQTLPLDKLRLDGDTQPRTAIDQSVVNEYARLYEAGVKFEPVDVFFDGTDYWLADGFHRWHAARKADLDKIKCNVHQGTQEDAQWFAIAANKTHGLQRSTADKAKAIKAALKHPKVVKMSDRQLAEYIGVSGKTVGKYRLDLEGRAEIPHAETRTDTAGREQPARKPRGVAEVHEDTGGRICSDCGNEKQHLFKNGTCSICAEVEYEKCPKCGGEEFYEDGTCESCVQDADEGEEAEVQPTDPGDPATILRCDIRDVVQRWLNDVADSNSMVAAAVLENCATELRDAL